MTNDDLRALADALSRQRQADEHGIYCAVPRQAVDAAIKHLRAQADAKPVPTAWRDPDTGELSRIGRVRWQPLYAHPAPAAPQAEPKREPLSDERIAEIQRAAYERAAQECDSMAYEPLGLDVNSCIACADAIRALGRQQ